MRLRSAAGSLMRKNIIENKPITEKNLFLLIKSKIDDTGMSEEEFAVAYKKMREHLMTKYSGSGPIQHSFNGLSAVQEHNKERRKEIRQREIARKSAQEFSNARSLQKERKLADAREERFQKYRYHQHLKQMSEEKNDPLF